jgi:hypothetical protein
MTDTDNTGGLVRRYPVQGKRGQFVRDFDSEQPDGQKNPDHGEGPDNMKVVFVLQAGVDGNFFHLLS